MCELFGMSSDRPISARSPLSLFQMRGGETADNPDGWGVAYLEGDAFTIHKAPEAAARSALFAKLAHQIHSRLIIAHVRKANPPTALTLENTHPFMRTCCGRSWVFAHNGQVPELIAPQGCCHPRLSHPEGDTDSEHAFIYLLEEIAGTFPVETTSPEMTEAWLETLTLRSSAIAEYGQFNFLLSDSEHLIAYGHDRLYSQQQMEGGVQSVVIASMPLSGDESWEAFAPDELRVYRGSQLLGRWSASKNSKRCSLA
ncbi:MAG: class II glutamine amidotransferase [Pseudomonadota bacterium]